MSDINIHKIKQYIDFNMTTNYQKKEKIKH